MPKPQSRPEESKEAVNPPEEEPKEFYALIHFDDKSVLVQEQSLFIASKLDLDSSKKTIRFAFYGQVLVMLPTSQNPKERTEYLEKIEIVKDKVKVGKVDRIVDPQTLHVKDLFHKQTYQKVYQGLRITLAATKQSGYLDCPFGKSGIIKVRLDEPLPKDVDTKAVLQSEVELHYKKNIMAKQANKFKSQA